MNPEKLKQMQDQVRIGGKVRSYIHSLYLEMGKNPNPATTNQTRTQVSSRAETEIETESKNVQKPKQNRTVPYEELNRTQTQRLQKSNQTRTYF